MRFDIGGIGQHLCGAEGGAEILDKEFAGVAHAAGISRGRDPVNTQLGLGPIDIQDLERGMRSNSPVSGRGSPKGLSPFQIIGRKNGLFDPYAFGARRILRRNAENASCGGWPHGASLSCPATKSDPRRARNLIVDWP
jgi:hypothetical protein